MLLQLAEWFEKLLNVVFGDSWSVVVNADLKEVLLFPTDDPALNLDDALLPRDKLDCVRYEVEEDLLETVDISNHALINVLIEVLFNLDIEFADLRF